ASPARAAPSLARLGTDVEALTRLAARHGGRVLPERDARVLDPPVRERAGRAEGGETESPWPVVPGGQVRETRARAVPLAPPFGTVGGLVLALGGLWLGRKRRQLD
ncbi:MAG TPA: LPXTG cell wall anchor domain-containing protein, partial [Fibrobacteria bacterium]|nr:LPXTG cell wall anchor domain-containing protein [Fibrobacteria bacterium]